ncbi:MAG: LamG domain-containing protein, partial [Chloroflexi bacterium]|nr:LamG domain-containing protein [Chloroflexota bacterium]
PSVATDLIFDLTMRKNRAAIEILKVQIPAGYGIGGQSLASGVDVGTLTIRFSTDNPWLSGQVLEIVDIPVEATGQAFSLAGNNDYVEVPHNDNFNLPTAGTLEVWFNANAIDTFDTIVVYGVGVTGTGSAPDLSYAINGRGFGLLGLVLSNGTDAQILTTPSVVSTGAFHHIGATWDGTDVKLYLDDTAVVEETQTICPQSSSTFNLTIGQANDNVTNSWDGLIDELAISDRALTASEINAIFLAGSNGKPTP